MRSRIMIVAVLTVLFLVIDYYVFQAVLVVSRNWSPVPRALMRYGFWVPTAVCVALLIWWNFADPYTISAKARNWVITAIFAVYISKLFAVIVLFIDDLQRGIKWLAKFFYKGPSGNLPGDAITRSDFLAKTAIAAAAIPFGTMAFGILSGAHDYRVRRQTIMLPRLPKAFDGLQIGQVSDIHSGSFFNKTAVKGGVEMLLREKPDVIFFTGDLVNNETSEVKDYINIFDKLRAPMGVYSVTGNHDYGDYKRWASQGAKASNFRDLIEAHRLMGFRLLKNEHDFLKTGQDSIAVLGIENWGMRGFTQYGRMEEAYEGTQDAPVKLLLSHDPSHWDGQVRPQYGDIDVMFSGHTHGFQFGVEIGNFKWSPSQYAYKQWAGLYQEGSQYLYVNRGFGYLGYPGRIGMPPELTIIELKRG